MTRIIVARSICLVKREREREKGGGKERGIERVREKEGEEEGGKRWRAKGNETRRARESK